MLPPGIALGQAADDSNQLAAARALGIEGVKLADAGDCKGAIDKLTRAESLHHAPTTAVRLGECQVAVGKLVAGTETLNRVAREELAPNAPQAFKLAQQRAQKSLEAALPRIAKLRVHLDGAPATGAQVKVDDDVVPRVLLDAELPTDPGSHKIVVTAPGMKSAEASVTLKDGEKLDVTLKLEPDPNAAPAPSASTSAAPPPPAPSTSAAPPPPATTATVAPPPPAPKSNTMTWVAFGAAGVGLAVGATFGVLTLSTKSSLDAACSTKTACPASSQSDIDALSRNATIANIGFGIGIVGLAVGTYLLATGGSSSAPSARRDVHVAPWLGLGGAGVRGTFQ